ncbi:ionotropic receptor 75a-like [Periplaneta americana]|uniref:ionotropic receptor 75a-like n=1 Tax=Periplaneta americana TaxID=6978 RepID=UPI0037E969B2
MKVAAFLSVYWIQALAIDPKTFSLISAFTSHTIAKSAVIFSCWSTSDMVFMMKFMSAKGMFVSIYNTDEEITTMKMLQTKYEHVAVIVDLQCGRSDRILETAHESNYVRRLHHWLLLSSPESRITNTLDPQSAPLDSNVIVASLEPSSKHVVLHDVYTLGTREALTVTPARVWTPGQPVPPSPRRDNFGGVLINAATIVIEDTMNLTLTDSWGYPKIGSRCYDGVVGLLECGDIEIGAVGLLQKDARLDRIDYAGETIDFGGKFMFLKPSLSEVSNIYTLPFNSSVWIAYTVIMAILTVALYMSQRMEQHTNPDEPPLLFGDAALNSLALICQEGTPRSPESMSSRILFMFILMLSLFLTTSYSAIIVSLLQMSSNTINSLSELLDSSFTLSMKNIIYNTNFVNDSKDPLVKKLYYEKIYRQPFDQAFTTQAEGVEKIRRGLHAFYGDAAAYKVMSDTYEEDEKCRLKEITINPSNTMAIPVKKGSPYKELITQKVLWLRERGMIDREYKRWFVQKSKCDSDSRGFVSVRIGDFYPTLVVLGFGVGGSIAFFILEFLYHKLKYGTCWPTHPTTPRDKSARVTEVQQRLFIN